MLKELIAVFKGTPPGQEISDNFSRMLSLAREMTLEADEVFWGRVQTPEQRKALWEKDVRVNQLERRIRQQVAQHLAMGSTVDVPYGLSMMSLVKDVERLGDYAKNLAETADLRTEPFPDDELVAELRAISGAVRELAKEAPEVFARSDKVRALELTRAGRPVRKRCDALVKRIAASTYGPSLAVTTSLAARFYKRQESHLLNLLSSLLMPLHKLDFFDEEYLDEER